MVADNSPRGYLGWDEAILDEDVAAKLKERGNRKPTRELMGSYVDNEDLKEEVCSSYHRLTSILGAKFEGDCSVHGF